MALTPSGDFTRYLAQNFYTKTELQAGALSTIYFTESEFIATSAGAGDAGKPVKLNSSGLIDTTMLSGGTVATHAALTAAHGATGAVVGTTNTQTLTNKTLTSPTINGGTLGGTTTLSLSDFSLSDFSSNPLITVDSGDFIIYQRSTNIFEFHIGSSAKLAVSASAVAVTGDLTVSGAITAGGVAVPTISSTSTLTNKTLTSPVISTISNTGTLTLPTSTDTLVGRATTDTLTNKTLTSATLGGTTTLSLSDFSLSDFSSNPLITVDSGDFIIYQRATNIFEFHIGSSAKLTVSSSTVAVTGNLTVSGTLDILTTHANLTAAHGATGAVVGTTNTQTLTNKTLTTPVIATVYGDTAANGDMGIYGTSNATRTTSYVKIQPEGGKTVVGGSDADHDFEVQNRIDDDYRVTVNLNATGTNYINSYNAAPGAFTGAPLALFGTRVTIDTAIFNINTGNFPASAAAAGTAGDIAWNSTHVAVCVATNTWKRVAIATW